MDELIGFCLQLTQQHQKFLEYILASAKRQSAKQLWHSLPTVYRQCAICYTDFWEAYEQVLPSKRHRAVGKDTGYTSYIEPSGSLEFNSRACLRAHSARLNNT